MPPLRRGIVGGDSVGGVPDPIAELEASHFVRPPRRPFAARLELPPLKPLEQFLRQPRLPRAGQLHRLIPGRVAVIAAVRALAVRLLAAVELPDAVGAVGVPRGAV